MSKPSKLFLVVSLALAASLATGVRAQQEEVGMKSGDGELAVGHRVEIVATVKSVDLAQRRVELQGPEGRVVPIVVGEDVEHLDKVKVGDKVRVQYFEALAVTMAKADASVSLSESTETLAPDEPGAAGKAVIHTVTAVAKVTAIDLEAGVATLVGPRGNAVDVEVAHDTLVKVKVGDLVQVEYTEALAAAIDKLAE
ncbi:MAG TPA: hypothetical protein VFS60_02970 [Thermoanaerobaculia bacterium]|nr:hypothetical protein [Thermoanaerobaculia bacterium]